MQIFKHSMKPMPMCFLGSVGQVQFVSFQGAVTVKK